MIERLHMFVKYRLIPWFLYDVIRPLKQKFCRHSWVKEGQFWGDFKIGHFYYCSKCKKTSEDKDKINANN